MIEPVAHILKFYCAKRDSLPVMAVSFEQLCIITDALQAVASYYDLCDDSRDAGRSNPRWQRGVSGSFVYLGGQ